MQTTIRRAIRKDSERMAALSGELGYPSAASRVADRLEGIVGKEEHEVLVAVDDAGDVVGWVHGSVVLRVESDPFVEVGGLVVDRRYRGLGIGTALVQEMERWAAGLGIQHLRIRSDVTRERTHGFYLRAGYELTKSSHVFDKKLK